MLPSEIARLVLGYLHEAGCTRSADTFLSESPHLGELRDLPANRRTSLTSIILSLSLLDTLDTYTTAVELVKDAVTSLERRLGKTQCSDFLSRLRLIITLASVDRLRHSRKMDVTPQRSIKLGGSGSRLLYAHSSTPASDSGSDFTTAGARDDGVIVLSPTDLLQPSNRRVKTSTAAPAVSSAASPGIASTSIAASGTTSTSTSDAGTTSCSTAAAGTSTSTSGSGPATTSSTLMPPPAVSTVVVGSSSAERRRQRKTRRPSCLLQRQFESPAKTPATPKRSEAPMTPGPGGDCSSCETQDPNEALMSLLDELLSNEDLQGRMADNINRTVVKPCSSTATQQPPRPLDDESVRLAVEQTSADPAICRLLFGDTEMVYDSPLSAGLDCDDTVASPSQAPTAPSVGNTAAVNSPAAHPPPPTAPSVGNTAAVNSPAAHPPPPTAPSVVNTATVNSPAAHPPQLLQDTKPAAVCASTDSGPPLVIDTGITVSVSMTSPTAAAPTPNVRLSDVSVPVLGPGVVLPAPPESPPPQPPAAPPPVQEPSPAQRRFGVMVGEIGGVPLQAITSFGPPMTPVEYQQYRSAVMVGRNGVGEFRVKKYMSAGRRDCGKKPSILSCPVAVRNITYQPQYDTPPPPLSQQDGEGRPVTPVSPDKEDVSIGDLLQLPDQSPIKRSSPVLSQSPRAKAVGSMPSLVDRALEESKTKAAGITKKAGAKNDAGRPKSSSKTGRSPKKSLGSKAERSPKKSFATKTGRSPKKSLAVKIGRSPKKSLAGKTGRSPKKSPTDRAARSPKKGLVATSKAALFGSDDSSDTSLEDMDVPIVRRSAGTRGRGRGRGRAKVMPKVNMRSLTKRSKTNPPQDSTMLQDGSENQFSDCETEDDEIDNISSGKVPTKVSPTKPKKKRRRAMRFTHKKRKSAVVRIEITDEAAEPQKTTESICDDESTNYEQSENTSAENCADDTMVAEEGVDQQAADGDQTVVEEMDTQFLEETLAEKKEPVEVLESKSSDDGHDATIVNVKSDVVSGGDGGSDKKIGQDSVRSTGKSPAAMSVASASSGSIFSPSLLGQRLVSPRLACLLEAARVASGEVRTAAGPMSCTQPRRSPSDRQPPLRRQAASTPRRRSHVRALDFSTPLRSMQEEVGDAQSEPSSLDRRVSLLPSISRRLCDSPAVESPSSSVRVRPGDWPPLETPKPRRQPAGSCRSAGGSSWRSAGSASARSATEVSQASREPTRSASLSPEQPRVPRTPGTPASLRALRRRDSAGLALGRRLEEQLEAVFPAPDGDVNVSCPSPSMSPTAGQSQQPDSSEDVRLELSSSSESSSSSSSDSSDDDSTLSPSPPNSEERRTSTTPKNVSLLSTAAADSAVKKFPTSPSKSLNNAVESPTARISVRTPSSAIRRRVHLESVSSVATSPASDQLTIEMSTLVPTPPSPQFPVKPRRLQLVAEEEEEKRSVTRPEDLDARDQLTSLACDALLRLSDSRGASPVKQQSVVLPVFGGASGSSSRQRQTSVCIDKILTTLRSFDSFSDMAGTSGSASKRVSSPQVESSPGVATPMEVSVDPEPGPCDSPMSPVDERLTSVKLPDDASSSKCSVSPKRIPNDDWPLPSHARNIQVTSEIPDSPASPVDEVVDSDGDSQRLLRAPSELCQKSVSDVTSHRLGTSKGSGQPNLLKSVDVVSVSALTFSRRARVLSPEDSADSKIVGSRLKYSAPEKKSPTLVDVPELDVAGKRGSTSKGSGSQCSSLKRIRLNRKIRFPKKACSADPEGIPSLSPSSGALPADRTGSQAVVDRVASGRGRVTSETIHVDRGMDLPDIREPHERVAAPPGQSDEGSTRKPKASAKRASSRGVSVDEVPGAHVNSSRRRDELNSLREVRRKRSDTRGNVVSPRDANMNDTESHRSSSRPKDESINLGKLRLQSSETPTGNDPAYVKSSTAVTDHQSLQSTVSGGLGAAGDGVYQQTSQCAPISSVCDEAAQTDPHRCQSTATNATNAGTSPSSPTIVAESCQNTVGRVSLMPALNSSASFNTSEDLEDDYEEVMVVDSLTASEFMDLLDIAPTGRWARHSEDIQLLTEMEERLATASPSSRVRIHSPIKVAGDETSPSKDYDLMDLAVIASQLKQRRQMAELDSRGGGAGTIQPDQHRRDAGSSQPEQRKVDAGSSQPEQRRVDAGSIQPEQRRVGAGSSQPERRRVDAGSIQPERRRVDAGSIQPERRRVDAGTNQPERRKVDAGSSQSEQRRVDAGTNQPERRKVDAGSSQSEQRRVDAGTNQPERRKVDAGSSQSEQKRVDAGTSQSERRRVDADTNQPERRKVDAGSSQSEQKRVDAGTSQSERRRVDAGKNQPERRRVDADTNRSERRRVDAGTNQPERRRVDADTNQPERRRVDAGSSLPGRRKVDDGTNQPERRRVDAGTNQPERRRVDAGTNQPERRRVDAGKNQPERRRVDAGSSQLDQRRSDATTRQLDRRREAADSRGGSTLNSRLIALASSRSDSNRVMKTPRSVDVVSTCRTSADDVNKRDRHRTAVLDRPGESSDNVAVNADGGVQRAAKTVSPLSDMADRSASTSNSQQRAAKSRQQMKAGQSALSSDAVEVNGLKAGLPQSTMTSSAKMRTSRELDGDDNGSRTSVLDAYRVQSSTTSRVNERYKKDVSRDGDGDQSTYISGVDGRSKKDASRDVNGEQSISESGFEGRFKKDASRDVDGEESSSKAGTDVRSNKDVSRDVNGEESISKSGADGRSNKDVSVKVNGNSSRTVDATRGSGVGLSRRKDVVDSRKENRAPYRQVDSVVLLKDALETGEQDGEDSEPPGHVPAARTTDAVSVGGRRNYQRESCDGSTTAQTSDAVQFKPCRRDKTASKRGTKRKAGEIESEQFEVPDLVPVPRNCLQMDHDELDFEPEDIDDERESNGAPTVSVNEDSTPSSKRAAASSPQRAREKRICNTRGPTGNRETEASATRRPRRDARRTEDSSKRPAKKSRKDLDLLKGLDIKGFIENMHK